MNRRTKYSFQRFCFYFSEPWVLGIISGSYSAGFLKFPHQSLVLNAYTTFYVVLLASIALYRVSPFHPLAKVPGPVLFKISKFAPLWYCWHGHQASLYKSLHACYGPVVRVAPNEISVADVDAIGAVLGSGGLPKGAAYIRFRVKSGPENLVTMNGDLHAARRRLWNRAMSTESLYEYESIIATRGHELVDALNAQIPVAKGKVDIGQWLNFFSFDFMSDLAFNAGSKMMKEGDVHKLWPGLHLHMRGVSILSHLPWIPDIRDRLPWFSMPLWPIAEEVQPAQKKDIWYHLMDEAGLEKVKPSLAEVGSDAVLTIIAGADTTSCAMTSLFWLILSNPECYKRLQKEIDSVYPPGSDPLDVSKHSNLPFLAACIQEALRLLPPAPVSGAREVPRGSGGAEIAGHFLPEGTQVWVPPQLFHLNPSYFSPRTEEFVPDRWLDSSSSSCDEEKNPNQSTEFKNDMNAYLPFSFGPANCAGRNLAKKEIMMVMSLLLYTFDFRFARGFDSKSWPERMQTFFVTIRPPMEVTITRRGL
ncbi:cytochrome P450 [Gymnopus androsaceus JB14]|uniref:Cytochrome P450 n=1 Tax=Gymnopus androsaceus JB14 TaxID=1447944 RepID=A0A6A4H350_9AGAR|nr:cytochrome P450 [Gymnopus androsaceus JB14]